VLFKNNKNDMATITGASERSGRKEK